MLFHASYRGSLVVSREVYTTHVEFLSNFYLLTDYERTKQRKNMWYY